jgi:NADPH:quinone reductase-like Zn-dependent oxidoreductase
MADAGRSTRSHPDRPPTTMMALRAHTRGGPEVLVYEQAPVPVPAAGEVLVEVHGASITFTELNWDETWLRGGRARTPVIPSHEVSGVVVALGEGVTAPPVGTQVYGLIRFDRDGAAADYVAVPAADLAPKPSTISHAAAATLPLAALTAWQAFHDHAHLQPGDHVLVHGGAGGVGALAVQLGKIAGAHVTATARGRDTALVERLGAERVLDFERVEFDELGLRFDVVLDAVGGQVMDRSFSVLERGGRLITLHAPPSQERARELGVTATFFIVEPDREELDAIAQLVDDGRLEVLVARSYALSDGRAAFESVSSTDRAPGKTVLVVRQ